MKLSERLTEKTFIAFIALSGVIFSAIVSYFVSTHQANVSVQNFHKELENRYNQKLYEKRLSEYPRLYEIVSNLGKDIRKIQLKHKILKERLTEIDEWDSQNAILLSPTGISLILELRDILDGYTNFDPDYDPNKQVGVAARESIFTAALSLEEALKIEIGVYDAKGYHNPPLPKNYPTSWEHVKEK
jgi:hypothetical protein